MGCASSTKCIEELYSMSFITDEAGQVPMPIVKPFVIRGTVQFKLRSNSSNNSSNEKQKRNSQIIQRESSRVILPSYSRIRIKAVGSTTIVYGNARFIWDDKLGLQTSRQWHGRCELDPGFGRTKTGAVRPTFKAGDVIKFEIGESSPVQIEPRQQGTYARDGSDLDVKNWTRT